MEYFYTIQGEGFHQGKAAFFIRLAGCNVGCVWCDVKESWTSEVSQLLKISFLIEEVKKTKTEIVVITGGEPLLYDCSFLINELHKENYKVHLETSGAYALRGNWDWICLSPKKFKAPIEENLLQADELKVIIFNKSDFEWAENYKNKCNKNCQLFLQAEWSKEKEMIPLIINYIFEHPQWQLCLQIHKYLNLP
ncbi:MAG: 7-carboxy-7-deazaguanine synthase QueE [Chitinophagaceae bacterium]|nr:7-carboxy-7-deazaguanine synthase QueE [Chitinophagaceae bacterium]